MPDDERDERFQHHEDILRRLTAMLVEQREMNHRMAGFMQQQVEINQRQVEINADIKTTLARVEALLARVIRPADNGRDA